MTNRERRLWNARARLVRFQTAEPKTIRNTIGDALGLMTLWRERPEPLTLTEAQTFAIQRKCAQLDRALVYNDWRAFQRGRLDLGEPEPQPQPHYPAWMETHDL